MTKEEAAKLWEEVKANQRALDDCPGPHEFETADDRKLAPTCKCKVCGGTVTAQVARWYQRGLAHGRQA